MSIIGHSIQSSVVNAHSALKEQLAAQSAAADEEIKRQARIHQEEELAREAVEEAFDAKGNRTDNATDRERREQKREREKGGQEGGHIDIMA
jgi:hypothetical protein